MYKILWFLIVSTFMLNSIYSTEVEMDIYFEENSAIYEYNFTFSQEDKFSSFSFEKPKDAVLIEAYNQDGENIRINKAGDYYIATPSEDVSNSTFFVKFSAVTPLLEIQNSNIFTTYYSFNFEVEKLNIKFTQPQNSQEILKITPRSIKTQENTIYWEFNEDITEGFILLEFEGNTNLDQSTSLDDYQYVILSFLILLIVFALIVVYNFFRRKGNKDSKIKISEVEESLDTQTSIMSDKEENLEINVNLNNTSIQESNLDEKKINTIESFVDKYLTDNEKDVVEVVVENEGIAQNEILHHLPSLTKSNLSKIITKLHGKRVLNRIRVGKINKIHLGEKLKENSEGKKGNN